ICVEGRYRLARCSIGPWNRYPGFPQASLSARVGLRQRGGEALPAGRGALPPPFRDAVRRGRVTASAVDQRIRSLRPPKAQVDPYVAQGSLVENERRPNERIEHTLTVFLTGAECPFTCSFCDLWRLTIDG